MSKPAETNPTHYATILIQNCPYQGNIGFLKLNNTIRTYPNFLSEYGTSKQQSDEKHTATNTISIL